MLFSSISWVMLTLTLLVALPGALASPSPKRSKKPSSTRVTPETYSAMEDGEVFVPPTPARLPAKPAPKTAKVAKTKPPKKANKRVQTLGAPAPVDPPISAPAAYVINDGETAVAPETVAIATVASAPVAAPKKFDVVPVEKRAQVMKRMDLCQKLFETTGRAYDYRSMTTAQLEAELEAVRADARPIAKQDPVAANPIRFEAVNAAPSEPDPILDAAE